MGCDRDEAFAYLIGAMGNDALYVASDGHLFYLLAACGGRGPTLTLLTGTSADNVKLISFAGNTRSRL